MRRPLVWAAMRASSKTVAAVCSSTVRSSGTRPELRANASRAVVSQGSIDASLRDGRRGSVAAEGFTQASVGEQGPVFEAACREGVTGVLLVSNDGGHGRDSFPDPTS